MRVTFFCFAKRKSPKKRRPPVCDPHAGRGGKPASVRLRGAPWNSLCAVRAARTATASQSTKHGRFDVHATPQPPCRRRSQRGWSAKQPHGPSLLSAWLSQRKALAPARRGRAQRWPVWMSAPRGPFCACREAQGWGRVRVPQDTRTSCSDSPQLFERSAQRAVSSAVAPPDRASQVARSEAKGHAQQGRPFFGDFLSATRKKVTRPPGRIPGLRPSHKHLAQSGERPPPPA